MGSQILISDRLSARPAFPPFTAFHAPRKHRLHSHRAQIEHKRKHTELSRSQRQVRLREWSFQTKLPRCVVKVARFATGEQ